MGLEDKITKLKASQRGMRIISKITIKNHDQIIETIGKYVEGVTLGF
jgi:hypothetical protein